MWDAKTKALVAAGKLVVLGVVQEQHAQRAKLYKQWKQYEFPIVQDSFTELGLAVVPVPILIDEFGYTMSARPQLSQIESLVNITVEPPSIPAPRLNPQHKTSQWLTANSSAANSSNPGVAIDVAIGDALFHEHDLPAAIEHYQASLADAKKLGDTALQGLISFRLGVAFRAMFDAASPESDTQDAQLFSNAVEAWTNALAIDPNQYIWRRRIQQYGPRQSKPYPFYDWIGQANQEIVTRGESPVELKVPLAGAEIAQPFQPNRKFVADDSQATPPDPEGKIVLDQEGLIKVHATVVPQRVTPGDSVRVHLRFEPDQGHWNNEADEMAVWLDESKSGKHSKLQLGHANAATASSDEVRTVEFEFQTSEATSEKTSEKSGESGTWELKLTGFALYYVCQSADGQCLYRRQNIEIPILFSTEN